MSCLQEGPNLSSQLRYPGLQNPLRHGVTVKRVRSRKIFVDNAFPVTLIKQEHQCDVVLLLSFFFLRGGGGGV